MSNHKNRAASRLLSAGGIALFLLILVFVNVLLARVNLRWDATRDNLYSLSDGSLAILASLANDVTIKVFYTRDTATLPLPLKTYAERVSDFLLEYENAAKGRVRVEFYDPRVDSEEEEWAQKYGIQALSLPSGETFYFGLVALSADQEETIAYLDPSRESYLEYDITRIITRVQSAKKPKISVISGLPVFGSSMPMGMPNQSQPSWLFIEELGKTYDVREVRPSATGLDEDTELVLIIYPKGISPVLQYAVDQHVMRGGNVMAFVDPLALTDPNPGMPGGASLGGLFESWGIAIEAESILVDMDQPTRLATPDNQTEINPTWVTLGADAFNADNMVTAKLETMLLPISGVLQKTDTAADVAYQPLLQSSPNSMTVNRMMARLGPDVLRRDFKTDDTRKDLAVLLRGTFNTAFPKGPPAEEARTDGVTETDAGASASLQSGRDPALILVVADSDLLYDSFYVNRQNFLGMNISQIFNDNLNFLLNSCEMLTGGSALIDIRSRGAFERPFTRVEALEKKAQLRWLDREQELVRKVEETNRKLQELEKSKDASQQFVLNEAQEKEIAKFRNEKLRINHELKMVRRSLRSDIEALGLKLKFVNIFGVPLLVALGGVLYAYRRRKRQARRLPLSR